MKMDFQKIINETWVIYPGENKKQTLLIKECMKQACIHVLDEKIGKEIDGIESYVSYSVSIDYPVFFYEYKWQPPLIKLPF